MFEFIRLQFKLKWGFNRNNDKKSAIMTAVATFLVVLIVLALIWGLAFVLKNSLDVSVPRLSVLYLTISMIVLTIAATGMQMKRLYQPGDLLITARFPLSPFKIFISYLILNYIDLCIYSAIFFFPMMLVFGFAMECMTPIYLGGILVGFFVLPLVPFALSVFIAIPLVYLSAILEKQNILRLVLFVVFLVGGFLVYDYLLTILTQFFIHRNWEVGTLEIWEKLLSGLDQPYNPAYYLKNVIFFDRFGMGIGVLIGSGVGLIVLGGLIAKAVCRKIRNQALEGGFGRYEKKSKIDGYSASKAIFRYGLKEILRNRTYSYFYLGVAISTPVMIFFCNRLVQIVGEAQIGKGINFGVSMLVFSVFIAMICSFTGSILSMEGKTFYITKLVPISYRKQLGIKGILNICVGFGALLISSVIVASLKFIDWAEIAVLSITQILLCVGLVFQGINLNLVNPNLKLKANGDVEEINITYMLFIGFGLAAMLGACCLIFPRIFENGTFWAYFTALGVSAIYMIVNFTVFWFTVNKKYEHIEM